MHRSLVISQRRTQSNLNNLAFLGIITITYPNFVRIIVVGTQ